jgi:hypothetical protein
MLIEDTISSIESEVLIMPEDNRRSFLDYIICKLVDIREDLNLKWLPNQLPDGSEVQTDLPEHTAIRNNQLVYTEIPF